ncbi:hypothetical protein CHLNCDRAFT_140579 [Chlorella variabilis]|uniref:Transcription factor TFIIB cyclin-like domain-containing protein n=1 Tax=Chlorella variabilis TaxID=554065 RepID=E1Z5Q5_CHLVA|nr:hypothetical protein CHLNCDRAFT_140579 [Chlorella variabilis]EFN58516.1 hypothetical protein CHLNCDRAFT_140579 [Chlorella variabilis]|eukprot:XP_005850618.1 hypothetical protein CHLNCDRAFT_140579 [Chlorella variabilis]
MDGACPKCGEGAVEFEEVEGVSACAACGWVVADEQLVHATAWDNRGAPQGVFVGAEDTGERAAAHALQASGPGLSIQRSKRGVGEARLKARVREFAALLRLQPPVVDQALHVAGRAVPHCLGNWRRDHLAAAATYAACRLNKLPLTLADLSGSVQIDVHTLGHYYCALCRLLDLQPPLLLPADLLPRSVDRVTAEAVARGALAAGTVAAVQRDAGMLLDWMHRQLNQRQFPLGCVGAALVLAAEMNTVSLSLDHVSASLPLCRSTLERKLAQTRQRLVQLSAFLPYSSTINVRNVGSHARTIIKLSALRHCAK